MGTAFSGNPLYQDPADENRHESAMKMLCDKFSIRPAVMKHIYEAILLDLKSRARVQQYLSIFVVRAIQDLIGNPTAPSMPELDLQQAEEFRKMLLDGRRINENAVGPFQESMGIQSRKDFRKTDQRNSYRSSTIGLQ